MEDPAEVFISYAHADNPAHYESRDWESARGWVECFYHILSERLRQIRGRPTEVWRDRSGRIRGATALTDAIREGIGSSKVLIVVTSPSYGTSEWCEAELRLFKEAWTGRGGLRVGDMVRVFKINKLPASDSSFLSSDAELMDVMGYDFYRIVDGSALEYDPPFGVAPSGSDVFMQRINSVARDIVTVLEPTKSVAPSGLAVFLADCTLDVRNQRENVRSDLMQRGHRVLEQRDPQSGDHDAGVRAALERAKLSIHIIGSNYGMIPEGSDISVEERDYLLAGEVTRKDFMRLSWLPPEIEPSGERQVAFAARLETDPNFHRTTVSLEDFKTVIADHLARLKDSSTGGSVEKEPSRLRRVYLVFDPPDREAAKVVDDWLHGQGFDVARPTPGTDSRTYRRVHNDRLRSSDGVLFYFGTADAKWLDSNLDQLWKIYSKNRSRNQPRARGVVLADPQTDFKREFRARLVRVVPGFGQFSPQELKEFVEDLRDDAPA